ncbi:MAG: MaoC family dehydratase N-terminal domain-containing protein [Chromatiales bacterium]|nr:MAG: MaoC family dehydratase N-terminal domain-containing protein [Chromatiales bacterium]
MALDYERLLNWPFDEVTQSYTPRDTMLYALGLGFGFNPTAADELRFVYEKGLQAFPTMPVVLGHPGSWMTNPDTGIDFLKVLHGEQHLDIHAPLPAEGTIVARNRVAEIIDKGEGRGALIHVERKIYEQASGDHLSTQTAVIFARNNGGFGGPVTRSARPHALPERSPDAAVDIPVATQAALLYRLSGDYNPLHADPAVAEKAGFPAPILHGLASYGIAARAVLQALQIADVARLRSFGLRFSAPVFPGETIRIEVWQDGDEVSFRARVDARDAVVLNNGRAVIAPA